MALVAILTLLLALTSSAPSEATEPLVDWTPAEADLAAWATGRFAEAGLDLPDDVVLTFHRSTGPCEGNDGTFRPAEGNRVRVCRFHDDPAIERRVREHVLLHELAHLWAHHGLTDADRDAFTSLREAGSWNDRTAAWHDRGSEQAAEILTWGLLDRDPGFLAIHGTSCDELTAAYELLTGAEPINPQPGCRTE